mmetsp:Transcript_2705/g.3711  ORF Transcript_2705/g.3711 Transcript_2705/m.3711 type:complete len:111 (+) Transcript_2705:47-379(+)
MSAFILSISSKFERFFKPFTGLDHQIAHFSKYISKSRTKRLPMTTKRAGKGFYKGNGARKEGVISSKGRFRLIREMCTEIIAPDLSDFKLKAYVAPGAKRHVTEIKVSSV